MLSSIGFWFPPLSVGSRRSLFLSRCFNRHFIVFFLFFSFPRELLRIEQVIQGTAVSACYADNKKLYNSVQVERERHTCTQTHPH